MTGRAQGLCYITLFASFAQTTYGSEYGAALVGKRDPADGEGKSTQQESLQVLVDHADDVCDSHCQAAESYKSDALLSGDATADETSLLASDPDIDASEEPLAGSTQRNPMFFIAAAILASVAVARMIWRSIQDLLRVQSRPSAKLSVQAGRKAAAEQLRRKDEGGVGGRVGRAAGAGEASEGEPVSQGLFPLKTICGGIVIGMWYMHTVYTIDAPEEQPAESTLRNPMFLIAAAILAFISFARMIWGSAQDLLRVQSRTSAKLSVQAGRKAAAEQRRRRDEGDLADVRAQLRAQANQVKGSQ